MAALWCTVILLFVFSEATQKKDARTVYNFEGRSQLADFSVPATSSLDLSTERRKEGVCSLRWRSWASGDAITHSFTSKPITGNELRRGGFKTWIYNAHPRKEKLAVSFYDTQTTPGTLLTVSRFQISLNFKGWRAIWVSYGEALVAWGNIDTMKITAPTKDNRQRATQPLYFDLLRLVDHVGKQSRDDIVPPIGAGLYTINHFWQQSYRWSKATPTAFSTSDPDAAKLKELSLIAKRFDNWFVKQTQSSTAFTGNVKKRWESLQANSVKRANENYVFLYIRKSTTGVIKGKPLYARDSDIAGQKFGYVMEEILLPLALDYHIRSRTVEVDAVATKELSNLNSATAATKAKSVASIAGADAGLQTTFKTSLGTAPFTLPKVKAAINTLNDKRKDRLLLLLDYLQDQGFTDGSALGSLDHVMNRVGAGFCNAVYLLRNVLGATRLAANVATMKWYSDFGEIYQDPFEYAGTSADRMRTISIYRLLAVLMMPTTTADEKKEKLRDMAALGRWYANIFTINEGLAGVLKPDFVGFHHNGFYASAYAPHAIHVAAFLEYIVSGTSFAFGCVTSDNIQKALEVMRVVSVKYSSPNSVCGRFPGFTRVILSKVFPAYAYHGATAPVLNDDGSLGPITYLKLKEVKMFLRLYDTTNRAVNKYLENGKIFTSIFYLNSIGSIDIMEEIAAKAAALSISAESSPKGFWSKNYAALVVHRREDWAVSMKGFNKFVWDYESGTNQNVYGLYQSHGALLVANSEEALKALDIDNGWDWTRHPGTTTIKLTLDKLESEEHRYFQTKKLAGGLVMYGGGDYPNGIFGMEFTKPPYKYKKGASQRSITFQFKKSVFFADNAVICLGSGITAKKSSPYETQTTLFQNKLVDTASPSSIYIGSSPHSLDTDLTKVPTDFSAGTSVTLMDVNGNGYYIPNAQKQGLNVKISLQTSKSQKGGKDITSARYATAWFDHGSNPRKKTYEYVIIVNKPNSFIQSFKTSQDGPTSGQRYKVERKDTKAHVVKINNSPRAGQTQYGYVFFDKSVRTGKGPVRRVDTAPCIVMVEEVDAKNLYIAASSPDLNLNITRTLERAPLADASERIYSYSQPKKITVYLKNAVQEAIGAVKEDGKRIPDKDKADNVKVIRRNKIEFLKLAKGFTTEVKLTRR